MNEPNTRRVRASDTERETTVSVLQDAMTEGRLTFHEGEQRIAAVYTTTYRDELPDFTADLPRAQAPPSGATNRPRERPALLIAGLITLAAVAMIGVLLLSPRALLLPGIPLMMIAAMFLRGRWHGPRPPRAAGTGVAPAAGDDTNAGHAQAGGRPRCGPPTR